MKPNHERLVTVLKDTISLLCKNSLSYQQEAVVQGLLCVTVDKEDVVVIQVNEHLGEAIYEPCAGCGLTRQPEDSSRGKRARKRRRRSNSYDSSDDKQECSNGKRASFTEGAQLPTGRVENFPPDFKVKEEEPSGDEDLILIDSNIKEEEDFTRLQASADDDNSTAYISGFMDSASVSGSSQAIDSTWPIAAESTDEGNIMASNSGSTTKTCAYCKLETPDRATMMCHIKDQHSSDPNIYTKTDGCPWQGCNKAFSYRSALQMHYRVHTNTKPFQCSICSQSFSVKGNLKRHLIGLHGLGS